MSKRKERTNIKLGILDEINQIDKRLKEEENKEVVGLEFDGNNVNVIVKR